MTIQAHAYATIHPSFMEPELLLQYTQVSGFTQALAGGELRVRLSEDDLLVYAKQLNIRNKMASGTASMNELPGVDITASMLQVPTYLFKCRSQFDHHDTNAAANWGFSAVEAYRLGMRQGNFQLARDAALHGLQPNNGEGLLNAVGATAINLPPDSYGNDTVITYDNGQMAFFIAQQILSIKTRTAQLGQGRKFTILGPQRILGTFEYNVVQLVQFQRPGAGTASTEGTLEGILMPNGDTLEWCYDDTLIGAGSGGTDAVLLVMTEVEKPKRMGMINTNAFAELSPANTVCTTQYCDMAAPREILSPLAAGKTDFVTEWRLTPGWAPRSTAVTIVSMNY